MKCEEEKITIIRFNSNLFYLRCLKFTIVGKPKFIWVFFHRKTFLLLYRQRKPYEQRAGACSCYLNIINVSQTMESWITEICLNFRLEWPRTFAPLFLNYNNWYLINVLYSTNAHNSKNIVLWVRNYSLKHLIFDVSAKEILEVALSIS